MRKGKDASKKDRYVYMTAVERWRKTWWGKRRTTGQSHGWFGVVHLESVLLPSYADRFVSFCSSSGGSVEMTRGSNDPWLEFGRKMQESSTGVEKWGVILIVDYKLNTEDCKEMEKKIGNYWENRTIRLFGCVNNTKKLHCSTGNRWRRVPKGRKLW